MAGARGRVAFIVTVFVTLFVFATLGVAAAARAGETPRYQAADYMTATRGRARSPSTPATVCSTSRCRRPTRSPSSGRGGRDAAPRVIARVPVCRFPDALAALPAGGVLVACRFEAGLRRVSRGPSGRWSVTPVDAGAASGARGLALSPDGRGRVRRVAGDRRRRRRLARGRGRRSARGDGPVAARAPRRARGRRAGRAPRAAAREQLRRSTRDRSPDRRRWPPRAPRSRRSPPRRPCSICSSRARRRTCSCSRTRIGRCRARTVPSRASTAACCGCRARRGRWWAARSRTRGTSRRRFANLSERAPEPVVELAAVARDDRTGALAIVGAGTDDVLLVPPRRARPARGQSLSPWGRRPSRVAALPGGRWVTADRLSDTLTFIERERDAGAAGRRHAHRGRGPRARPTPSSARCSFTAACSRPGTSPTGRCRCTPAPPATTTATSTAAATRRSATASSR